MGLSGDVVEWWQEWQLRILVLGSLFIQYFLCFSFWVRRSPGGGVRRFLGVLVWIAYVGGDAVAIYALATLFDRKKQCFDGKSSALEVVWAPVLLIHLGGQPWISAYSLQNNDLWGQHIVTLVSKVTLALYLLCKWWSGEKTLLAAEISLFVVGITKLVQKPWALRTASSISTQALRTMQIDEGRIYSLEEYVQAAREVVLLAHPGLSSPYSVRFEKHDETLSFYMFVDQSAPYSVRIQELSYFLRLGYIHAYKRLYRSLEYRFYILYTRIVSNLTGLGAACSVYLFPSLALASVVLFAVSHKDGHNNKKDIMVTYILFCCTTILELLLPCMVLAQRIPFCPSFLGEHLSFSNDGEHLSIPMQGCHDMVCQYNMMFFCVHKKKPRFLMKLATLQSLMELVNQHWYIQQKPIAYQITATVRRHLEDGWKNYIHDAASYRRFNDLRGQWALRRHRQLGWSLNKPFDESVLIWHIATDLCFYHPNASPQSRQGEATWRGREISNYMMYLLLIRPEMLMHGSRSDLFILASEKIVKNSSLTCITAEILAGELLNMPPSSDNVISNAIKLAQELMELVDERERWTVIQGVWVEMLCYSASQCRGYLHAKSLGEGEEYLSTVWLLWSFMGMETLADRHHMSEAPQEVGEEEEEAAAAAAALTTCRSQGRASQCEDMLSPV